MLNQSTIQTACTANTTGNAETLREVADIDRRRKCIIKDKLISIFR
jgi:hypothetical protein